MAAARWRLPLLALAVGLGAGAGAVALFHRTTAVAVLVPGSGAWVTSAQGAPVAVPADGGLRPGERVHTGAHPAQVVVGGRTRLTLQPHGQITMTVDADTARLDRGVAIVDTQAVVEQVRIATAAGDVVLTKAIVEIRAASDLPSPDGARS